ncbi:hypothetical protein ACIA8K_40130 [Catenuloplanes sp. NPDC051500]|uniref:hypothetical protein n=1 Tax=Catenuloplanes sp. NPDC051500 TaxID=3363959 RepID=UPI0037A73496
MIDRTGRWIGLIGAVLCCAWAATGLNLPGLTFEGGDAIPVDAADIYIRDDATGLAAFLVALDTEKLSLLLGMAFAAALTLGVRSGWSRVAGPLWLALLATAIMAEATDVQSSSYITEYVGYPDEITATLYGAGALLVLSALALACGLYLVHDALLVLLMLGAAGLHLAMLAQAPSIFEEGKYLQTRFTWEAWLPAWLMLGAAAFGIVAAVASYRLRRRPAAPRVWTAAALVRGVSGTPGTPPGFEPHPRLRTMLLAGVLGTLMIVGAFVAGHAAPPPEPVSVPTPRTTR